MFRSVAFLALLGIEVLASEWNYNRCDENGPANWPDKCKAQQSGSPVNLCGGQAFNGAAPNMTLTGYDALRRLKVMNNGHTLQVNIMDNAPSLTIGNLSTIIGYSTEDTSPKWVLEQMHLHWGREGLTSEGSEHFFSGRATPMEAHFVHYNAARGSSVKEALDSGKKDALLVVGVLFTMGETDQALIVAMAAEVATARQAQQAMTTEVRLADVIDGVGAYFSYPGSLTTPPCTEAVTWVVMQNMKTVTEKTLDIFKLASSAPPKALFHKFFPQSEGAGPIATYGNFRPPQPTNNRVIYSSTGATAACVAAKDPFLCSTAFSASPIFLLNGAAIMALLLIWYH